MDLIVLLESLKKKSEKINWWQGHLNDIKPNTNARKSNFVTDLCYNFNTYHHSKDDSAKTEWWSVKWPWTAAVLELWIYINVQ